MWVRLDDQFTEHRKLERVGPLAGWLHVSALCYSARHLTDGRIPKSKAYRLADVPKPAQLIAKLVEANLWEDDGDDYVIHDYHDYNPTAEEELEKRRKRSEAGRKGGLKSKPPGSRREANAEANASANAPPNGQANPEAPPKQRGKQNTKPNGTPSPESVLNKDPLQRSARARPDRGRNRGSTSTNGAESDLDSADGTPDERVLRAIDAATRAEVDQADDRGECKTRDGLTNHVRQRNIDQHYQELLRLARQGWTPRDLWARMENSAHRPTSRSGAA